MSRVVSIFVGQPKTYIAEDGSEWQSAIFKTPVHEPIALGLRSLEGDKVADTKHHGTPDMALCAYPIAHYDYWNETFGCNLEAGNVGENITIDGLHENQVCIGDIYQLGTARIQVSQPRFPCYKQERHTRVPGFLEAVFATGRTGWYFRVLEPGTIQTGEALSLTERLLPDVTVADVSTAMFGPIDPDICKRLSELKLLSDTWREALASRQG
jgi:MOSC domain-containing protein YiiM